MTREWTSGSALHPVISAIQAYGTHRRHVVAEGTVRSALAQ